MDAKKSVISIGANIDSKDAMLLKGNDVNIVTLEEKLSFDYTYGNGHDYGEETKHTQSSIHSGGLLSIIANNNIELEAVSLESLDTYLYAKNDVNILAAIDTKEITQKRESESLFSKNKTTDQTSNTSILRTDIKTNSLTIIGDNSVTLDSVTGSVKTMDVETLELNFLSQKESSSSQHSGDDEGIFTKTVTNKGFVEEKLIETDIKISDKMTLNGKDITDSLKSIDNTKVLLSEYDLKNENITQTKTELKSKTWNESTTTLTTVGSLVLGAVVSFATAGVMSSSFMTSLLPSATSTTMSTVSTAVVKSLVSSTLNSLGSSIITGEKFNLDIGDTFKGALSSGFIAGATPSIYDAVGLPENTKLTNLDFTQKISKTITDAVVNASINSLIYNTSLVDNLKSNVTNGIVDMGYSYVGDIAQKYEYKDGSFQKTALHAIWGGVGAEITGGDFVDGASSAAVRELVSPLTAKTNKEDKKEDLQLFVSQIAGITTGKIVGGDEGALTGNTIASSAEINNRQLHEDEILWLEDKENIEGFIKYYEEKEGKTLSFEEASKLLARGGISTVDKTYHDALNDEIGLKFAEDFIKKNYNGSSKLYSPQNGSVIGYETGAFNPTKEQYNNFTDHIEGYQNNKDFYKTNLDLKKPNNSSTMNYLDGAYDVVYNGIKDMFSHPIDALIAVPEGKAQMITDPVGTTNSIANGMNDLYDQSILYGLVGNYEKSDNMYGAIIPGAVIAVVGKGKGDLVDNKTSPIIDLNDPKSFYKKTDIEIKEELMKNQGFSEGIYNGSSDADIYVKGTNGGSDFYEVIVNKGGGIHTGNLVSDNIVYVKITQPNTTKTKIIIDKEKYQIPDTPQKLPTEDKSFNVVDGKTGKTIAPKKTSYVDMDKDPNIPFKLKNGTNSENKAIKIIIEEE